MLPSPEAHPNPEPYLNLPDPQDPDPRTLLSINSCGLKWHSTPIMATYSAAAGCLYEMCQNTNHMHVISRRLAASRLVPLLQICMEAETDGETAAGAVVCAACWGTGMHPAALGIKDASACLPACGCCWRPHRTHQL